MEISKQFNVLAKSPVAFAKKVGVLQSQDLKVLQINIGKWCNQACRHCHVDASPARKEQMSEEIALLCLEALAKTPSIDTIDLTGGAPEGHEQFRMMVEKSRELGKKVIDRCNLTILSEPGQEDLAEFLAKNEVEVVSSLPYFAASKTDKQRGNGVFAKSIAGLKQLNELGYGKDPKLPLHLVYNPTGILLSGSQEELQKEFKAQLLKYDIVFNDLYCINNLPVNRFLESLERAGKFEEYMDVLLGAFNPQTIEGLMCRHQINVSYDGYLFDCDFNQMLDMKTAGVEHIKDWDAAILKNRRIKTNNHCFGCTAGAGSSCGGELV